MRTKQRSSQCRVPRASLLLTLTTIILFSCSQQSLAQQQQWSTNGNDISNTNTGNVGVGTTTPASKLDVNGRIQQTGSTTDLGYLLTNSSLFANTTALNPGIAFFGGNGINALYGADLGFNSTTGRYRTRVFSGHKQADVAFGYQVSVQTNPTQSAFIELLTVRADSGNVGIGTTDPARKLDLFGDVAGISFEAGTGSPNSGVIRFGDNTGWKLHFGRSRNSTGGALNSGTAGVIMTIQDNGNIGIGTHDPGHKLDVVGEIRASGGFRFADGTLQTTAAGGGSGAVSSVFGRTGAVVQQAGDYTWAQINKSTSSLADIATRSAGDLSSGTLPDARFPTTLPAVSGANLTALNASNLANGTVPIARLGSGTADSTKFLRGDNTWAVPAGTSQWTTTSGTNNISYNSGNVGIGTTTNPSAKLEVVGNVSVTGTGNITATGTIEGGNIKAKYQDVAEWVESSQELVAGTVVVLDSSRSNQVIAATQSYDSRVAGVISLRPGLTLGEEAEGRVLVATTGRVRVKVDATSRPIQIGDLLVTSDREGFAMKSLPVEFGGARMHRPGTLIGKALEPLAKGTGEILVLLSLQ